MLAGSESEFTAGALCADGFLFGALTFSGGLNNVLKINAKLLILWRRLQDSNLSPLITNQVF